MKRSQENRIIFDVHKRLELSQQQMLAYSRDFASIYRKEREKQRKLEQTHQKLRAVVNSISEAMVATDHELNIQDFNQAFKQLLSSQAETFLGKSLVAILPEAVLEKNIEIINQKSQTAVNFECSFPSQPEAIFLATVSKMLDEKKQRSGYVFLFRDITETKRFNLLKSHIITFASHEIQTPLHGLLGFLHLVHDNIQNRLSEDELAHFNFLMDSGKNLQRMIDEMMCFMPLNHTDEINRSLVNLSELLSAAIQLVKAEVQNPGVQIRLPSQINATILVDRDLMIKALENILKTFLVYFGADGNIEIELLQTEEKLELQFCCPEISVNGWEELQKQLNSPSLFPDGTDGLTIGLGLSREIVEWNKGKIILQTGEEYRLILVFPIWNQAVRSPAKEG